MLYTVHVTCACISIAGFALRGFWMLSDSPLLQHRASRVLPHIVDTLLLVSALAMLVQWQMSPLALPWLVAKVVALLVYIGLGMVALRFGRNRKERVVAWVLALATAGYIVSVALTKDPWGVLAAVGL
ncbi:MAG: SirB2 family protein [Halioglobus sp.]|nr:SirB2 family protein [Halioglobus sp.]